MDKYKLKIIKKKDKMKVFLNKPDCKIVALDSLNKALNNIHSEYIKASGFDILKNHFPEQYKEWWLEIDWIELKEYGNELGIRFKSHICVEDYREKFSNSNMLFSAEIFDTENMPRFEYEKLGVYQMSDKMLESVYVLKAELELCYNGYEANERLFEKVESEIIK